MSSAIPNLLRILKNHQPEIVIDPAEPESMLIILQCLLCSGFNFYAINLGTKLGVLIFDCNLGSIIYLRLETLDNAWPYAMDMLPYPITRLHGRDVQRNMFSGDRLPIFHPSIYGHVSFVPTA